MKKMLSTKKLFLLDADVIIDFAKYGVLDSILRRTKCITGEIVAEDEVKYYLTAEGAKSIDLSEYIDNKILTIEAADFSDLQKLEELLPQDMADIIDEGEKELLAIMTRRNDLTLISCDHGPIRCIPFIDRYYRVMSLEIMLKSIGIKAYWLEEKHTEKYMKGNLDIGRTKFIQSS